MTEEAIMYIIGLALLAVTCLIAFFYSRSTDRFDWWRLAEVSVSFLTLIAVVVYAGINYNQWTETRRLAETATRQLEMTDRPWLAARVVVTQPLKPGIDNISLIFVVVLKNIGKSVATHIDTPVRLYAQPYSEKIFSEPMRQQAELCDRARRDRSPSRFALFPDEEASFPASASMGRDTLKGMIVPFLVGCVDYQYTISPVHHQTRFIYELSRYEPDSPHMRLIDFTKPDLPPLSRLRLEKYFFGGNDAD